MIETPTRLGSRRQAAAIAGISLRTLDKRVAAGEVRAFRSGVDRRRYLIALEDIERLRQPIPLVTTGSGPQEAA